MLDERNVAVRGTLTRGARRHLGAGVWTVSSLLRGSSGDAQSVLEQRLARGGIGREEFEERRGIMEGPR